MHKHDFNLILLQGKKRKNQEKKGVVGYPHP